MTEEDKKLFMSEKFDGLMHEVPFDRVLTQVKILGAMHIGMYHVNAILSDSLRDSEEWRRLCQLFGYLWEAHGLTSDHKLVELSPKPTLIKNEMVS